MNGKETHMLEIEIRGTNRFYEDLNSNNKEVIVLIHGHPFDHTMWSYQLGALKNFRLILPDLKGYGRSEIGVGDIFIEEQALDIALLLDSLMIERVHLLGLSMGGQIIIEFARLFPHRILSLVVCDSNIAAETDITLEQRLQLAQTIQQIGMKTHTDETIEKYLHKDVPTSNRGVYDHLYTMMTKTTTGGAVASHRGRAKRRNNLDYLHKINVPVLVIVGDNDAFTTESEMRGMAQKIKQVTFVVIPKAGHMPNMEQPLVFNQAILSFYVKRT